MKRMTTGGRLFLGPILMFLLSAWAHAGDMGEMKVRAQDRVWGQVINIDADRWTVKSQDGKEWLLRIDQETIQVGSFDQGAYVQAWVWPDGRTESIIAYRTNRETERELSMR